MSSYKHAGIGAPRLENRHRGSSRTAALLFLGVIALGFISLQANFSIVSKISTSRTFSSTLDAALRFDESRVAFNSSELATHLNPTTAFLPSKASSESFNQFCTPRGSRSILDDPPNLARDGERDYEFHTAGMMNTGTNFVHSLFHINCNKRLRNSINFARFKLTSRHKIESKHSFLSVFDSSAFNDVFDERFPLITLGCGAHGQTIPQIQSQNFTRFSPCRIVVITRDPLDWAYAMCRQTYPGMRVSPRCKRFLKGSSVTIRLPDGEPKVFPSLAHAFNEWYMSYVHLYEFLLTDPSGDDEKQAAMREQISSVIFLRYEDVLLRPESTTKKYCDCFSRTMNSVAEKFILRSTGASPRKRNQSNIYESAYKKLLFIPRRNRSQFDKADVEFFRTVLDPKLLEFFGYAV